MGEFVIRDLLTEVGIDEKIIRHIVDVVRLHLIPFDYYKSVQDYSLKDAIDDLKPRMEGMHVEVCINAYGDIAHNPPMHECWEFIGKMLNDPHFYSERTYSVE